MNVNEKINALRSYMAEHHIDVYWIPNEDDHLSDEYTAAYYNAKTYMSGFTGDYGALVITKDWAGLWTDGRHFTQAEIELAGSEIELMRMRQEGVPTIDAFMIDATPSGGVLAVDGRTLSAEDYQSIAHELKRKDATLRIDIDLVDAIWNDRPKMPQEEIFVLSDELVGESVISKVTRIRQAMQNKKTDVLVLTELEDPCWLLNVRGRDLACTPVPYAFAMITMEEVRYYIDSSKVPSEVSKLLRDQGIVVKAYEAFADDLKALKNVTIWTSLKKLNALYYLNLDPSNRLINLDSPVLTYRSIKNETEIENTKKAHIKDGVAMVKFIYWLKNNVQRGDVTEVEAQNYLYQLRAEQEGYICPSFDTICAYGPNAAMMHYTATQERYAVIEPKGLLLVDSGGTYLEGTTDITRTIAVGPVSDEERILYTKVLQGHLQLSRAKFLEGTNGYNLDILARGPVWDLDIDYQCATGHGVGHILSVHEGPYAIRWGARRVGSTPFVSGNIVSNEPGVYLPGVLGIRIENELLVRKGIKNFYGQFMYFEDLTYCPIDTSVIDTSYLSKRDIEQLNAYHERVYQTLKTYLSEEECQWLRRETEEIA